MLFVALISGLEGLSLELLRTEPREEDVERARRTLHGLLDATLACADLLPSRDEG